MSKVYVVSYDFREPATSLLAALSLELTKFEAWWHFIDGTWLICTGLDAKGIYARLKPYVDEDANLLILEAGADSAGLLPKQAWEWIRRHTAELAAVNGKE